MKEGLFFSSPEILNSSRVFGTCDTSELLDTELEYVAAQVQKLVIHHNQVSPNQMYVRALDEIIGLMRNGDAVLIAEPDLTVAYFGGMSPQLEPKEVQLLGKQIVELGNSITHPKYRRMGLAIQGTTARIEKGLQKYGEHTLMYCTTESPRVIRTFEQVNSSSNSRWHLEAVPFNRFPYLAGKTCIYAECGEDTSHVCANVRRKAEHSTRNHLSSITSQRESHMPCTLVVSDLAKALEYQNKCMQIHEQLLPEFSIVQPSYTDLTTEDILGVSAFYQKLRLSVLPGHNGFHHTNGY